MADCELEPKTWTRRASENKMEPTINTDDVNRRLSEIFGVASRAFGSVGAGTATAHAIRTHQPASFTHQFSLYQYNQAVLFVESTVPSPGSKTTAYHPSFLVMPVTTTEISTEVRLRFQGRGGIGN